MKQIFQRGLDVSRYQGQIDWNAVARAGYEFAILRAVSSDGQGVYTNPMLERNYRGAKAAGLRTGAYYYTYAQTEYYADLELAELRRALQGKQLEYPVFCDLEAESIAQLGRQRTTQLAEYALSRLRESGFYAGLYTYTFFAETNLEMQRLAAYPLWIADYRESAGYKGAFQMWQYTGSGRIAGITGNVCLDEAYTDFLPAIRQCGCNGYEKQPELPEMIPAAGFSLEVYGARNCEYFNTPDVSDIAGTLTAGRYEALAQSAGCFDGFTWVTIRKDNTVYWTALLADRCFLLRN